MSATGNLPPLGGGGRQVEYEIGLRFVNLSKPLVNGLVNATFFRLTRAQRYQLAVALLRANEIETT